MSAYEEWKHLDPRSKQMPSDEYLAEHQHPEDPPLNLLILQEDLQEAIELIERMRAEIDGKDILLHRAADTLEEEFGKPDFNGADLSNRSPWNLIIELRKAAGPKRE